MRNRETPGTALVIVVGSRYTEPMKSAVAKRLAKVKEHRLAARWEEAFGLLRATLKRYGDEPEVLREACRLNLAIGNTDEAQAIYATLAGLPLEGAPAEGELLARLFLLRQSEGPQWEDVTTAAYEADWVATLLQQGSMDILPLRLHAIRVQCGRGYMVYHLQGICPYCDHPKEYQLERTFAVMTTLSCNACLAPIHLDFDLVESFVKERHLQLLAPQVYDLERPFFAIQNELGHVAFEDAPLSCRSMNQNYLFLLNQLLADALDKPL